MLINSISLNCTSLLCPLVTQLRFSPPSNYLLPAKAVQYKITIWTRQSSFQFHSFHCHRLLSVNDSNRIEWQSRRWEGNEKISGKPRKSLSTILSDESEKTSGNFSLQGRKSKKSAIKTQSLFQHFFPFFAIRRIVFYFVVHFPRHGLSVAWTTTTKLCYLLHV